VVQVISDEPSEEQQEFVQAVMEGLANLESGREFALDEVKK
jgi:hypothetical protein